MQENAGSPFILVACQPQFHIRWIKALHGFFRAGSRFADFQLIGPQRHVLQMLTAPFLAHAECSKAPASQSIGRKPWHEKFRNGDEKGHTHNEGQGKSEPAPGRFERTVGS